ncbi:hypothetical protein [Planktotalea arctica]|nr:hypothetical protein [Planktotalea arctica]
MKSVLEISALARLQFAMIAMLVAMFFLAISLSGEEALQTTSVILLR